MKSKFNLRTLNNSKCTLIVLLFCFMSYSCKKESSSQTKLINIDLTAAKTWAKLNLKIVDTNPFTTMSPNWNDIYTTTQGNQVIIEVGLNNPNLIFIGDSPNDATEPKLGLSKSNIRLVLFKNINDNTIVTGCYMAIVNNAQLKTQEILHYKNVGNLSGKVYYFNANGSFSNGSLYVNGQIAKNKGNLNLLNQSLINIKLLSLDAKKLNGSLKNKTIAVKSPCADGIEIPIWGQSCVGVEGYEVCSPYISGFAHLPGSCDGDYGENEGYAGTHGGGGGTGTTSMMIMPPPPELPITDIKKFLSCFDKNKSASLTVYAEKIATSFPGHAFISIKQGSNTMVLGFYPKENFPSTVSGPGVMADNGEHAYNSATNYGDISAEKLQKITETIIKFSSSNYILTNNNCANFVLEVLRIMGVTDMTGICTPDNIYDITKPYATSTNGKAPKTQRTCN